MEEHETNNQWSTGFSKKPEIQSSQLINKHMKNSNPLKEFLLSITETSPPLKEPLFLTRSHSVTTTTVFFTITLAYYYGVDLGKDAGTVELIRSFDAAVTYPNLDDGLKNWIGHNERPFVVPFDERTIEGMFGNGKVGVVLFNGGDSAVLTDALLETSKDYAQTDGKPLIFT